MYPPTEFVDPKNELAEGGPIRRIAGAKFQEPARLHRVQAGRAPQPADIEAGASLAPVLVNVLAGSQFSRRGFCRAMGPT